MFYNDGIASIYYGIINDSLLIQQEEKYEMLKKLKLSSKLAVIIGGILTVIFAILIIFTVSMSKRAISSSIGGELTAISELNAIQIQQTFDEARTVATDIKNYVERTNKTYASDVVQNTIPTDPSAIALSKSTIYADTVLTPMNYDIETYLRETARNTALTNEDITGIGVMFEPYAFQSNMKSYSFYINKKTAEANITPFADYETYSKEAYYQGAVSAKADVVTDPYEYEGETLITYASPIMLNNAVVGVVMTDIDISKFDQIQTTNESYPSMYCTIYDDKQTVVYDSETKNDIGKKVSDFTPNPDEYQNIIDNMAKGQAFNLVATREDGRRVSRFYTPIHAGTETWWSLTAISASDVNAAVEATAFIMIILSVIALVVIILTIIALLRRVLHPMQSIVTAAQNIAHGQLNAELPEVTSNDEIGMLTNSFAGMTENLSTIVEDIDYLLGEMAEGNFNVKTRAEQNYIGDFENILLSVRKLHRKLSVALSQINTSADQVSAGSEQVSSGAQALSQGSTEQASAVQELAATINNISFQVQDTANNAKSASEKAEVAGTQMFESNQQMEQMIDSMHEISQSSSEIGKIIKTIEDIAFQTNILALNAAVEAARAGTAGKGFAVVADEVRNLASKSAEASKNTATLIERSISLVNKGTKIADTTAQYLSESVGAVNEVVGLVGKITAATVEQADSISQVTTGMDQIASVVQTNSATAEQSAAASEELSGQAQMMKQMVSQFKLKDLSELNYNEYEGY